MGETGKGQTKWASEEVGLSLAGEKGKIAVSRLELVGLD